ncbi:MAG: 3-hydroxyacyl-CoA dehydrogenase NAD-binding domain-containing protein [bacterium]|nr:3-hydroxyacyl-CoA dehydrogenase NAD-binding domain-containing protein [bacterium]
MSDIGFKIEQNGIARLTFNLKAEKVNKLTSKIMSEMSDLLKEAARKPDIKVLIIDSGKQDMFIAGADINEIDAISDPESAIKVVTRGQHIIHQIATLPFLTVALINGPCLGGGLELALACDFRVVTDNPKTKLGLPEVNLGIIPGFGGTQRLPKLIGVKDALDLILTGKHIDGNKAVKLHVADKLVNTVFRDQQTEDFAVLMLHEKQRQNVILSRRVRGFLNNTTIGRALVYAGAKKAVMAKSKGQYPAPLAALKVVRRTVGLHIQKGLDVEAQAFGKLAPTQISKNLIGLFFLSEALKKNGSVSAAESRFSQAAVLGAGLMGGGIAWALSSNGIPVRLKDISHDAIAQAFQAASKIYGSFVKRRKLTKAQVTSKMGMITGTLDYGGFASTDVVIEAIPENIDLKIKIFKELEKEIRPDTIIATNTSALDVDLMAKSLKHPKRFVGMHFFSPVNRMPLVEVIPSAKTDPAVVQAICDLATKMGKTPIVVQNCPGFLVNRILLPYVNEAVHLIQEGLSIEEVDKLMVQFGMPLGPLALADEVGLDVGIKVCQILESGYGSRMAIPALFHPILLDDTLRGKKTGKGFYIHTETGKTPNTAILALHRSDSVAKPSKEEAIDRLILRMVNEGALCLEEGIVKNAQELDMAMIMGTGFPPFRGGLMKYAQERGVIAISKRLDELAEKHGERFISAAILRKDEPLWK